MLLENPSISKGRTQGLGPKAEKVQVMNKTSDESILYYRVFPSLGIFW